MMTNWRVLLHNHLKLITYRSFASGLSTVRDIERVVSPRNKMRGWQINSYGELDELEFFEKLKIPLIQRSSDVLVKVHATGVNPIDVAMIKGYGAGFLKVMRCSPSDIEFPITLGREFAGTVAQKGMASKFKVGDPVWGVVPVQKNGCHAEYVLVPEYCVSKKPKQLSSSEASCILYAGLTAWSGIYISGQLGGMCGAITSSGGGHGKRVLVLGAAGGVGSTAVQILHAENAEVIATCSTDAVQMVQKLGANHVIDYTKQAMSQELNENGPYDLILDCAGQGPEYAEKFNWKFKNFVTFSSPLLKNIDSSGLGVGMFKNIADLIETNSRSFYSKKGCIKWGYFVPAPQGIEYLKNLVDKNQLLPVIDSRFQFHNANDAYRRVSNGHLRGKVVIDLL